MEHEDTGGRNDGWKHAEKEDLLWEEQGENALVDRKEELLITVEMSIGIDIKVQAVIDTGATHSCVDYELYVQLLERNEVKAELPV